MIHTLKKLDFENVLCSHQHKLFSSDTVNSFFSALTDKSLLNAHPTEIHPYDNIPLLQYNITPDFFVVFDKNKLVAGLKEITT